MKSKSILLLVFMIGLSFGSYSQTKSYAEKAHQKRTTGYILLAGGAAMITVALASDLSSDSPGWLVAGSLSTLASIPFFVSASKNKKKAGTVSGLLEVQRFPLAINSPPSGVIPSLKLRIRI